MTFRPRNQRSLVKVERPNSVMSAVMTERLGTRTEEVIITEHSNSMESRAFPSSYWFHYCLFKPAIRGTNLLEHIVHSVHFNRFAAKWLNTMGLFSAHHAHIVLQFGRHHPNKGTMAPEILPKMANISVSGVLRPNDCGFACLLLRMDAHSCC